MLKNNSLLQRSLASVWHPCTQMKQHEQFPLVPIARGEGVWLYDNDGKRYLDAVSSWWVNLFGHNNVQIKDAIKAQLDTLEHVMLAGFTHEPVVALSEKLAKLTGLGHAFYASDGASATEIALKMSFHYWQNTGKTLKTQFICLQNSYHGETLGALSVTDVAIFKDTYAPLLRQAALMPSPDFRLAEAGEAAEDFAIRCAEALEQYVREHHATLAAFIIEPLVQCAAGMGMYHPAYLKRAREICTKYSVHLIADEIAVGFGRTGTMFAMDSICDVGCSSGDNKSMCTNKSNCRPDFICLSKGITGGYLPLSAVLTTDSIYQVFYDDRTVKGFLHSHSYTGNPLACSAALATLAIFENDNVIANNHITTEKLNGFAFNREKLNGFSQTHFDLPIKHMRNQGMIWAFDVQTQNPQFAQACYQAALQNNLLIRPIGNTVYWMPPYTLGHDEIDFMVKATVASVKAAL